MNYDQFCTVLHEALGGAGLMPFVLGPTETMDIHQMSRAYRFVVALGDQRDNKPFTVTATLEWEWDAALAARSATTEEDLLEEILGQDGYYLVTEQPWLRLGVTLNATLPWDALLPLPGAEAWQQWWPR